MINQLPVSRLIRISVNLSPQAARAQNLSTLLLLGNTEVIDPVEGIRFYGTIEEVAADFGVDDPEYMAALLWFGQSPKPTSLAIGRWAQTDIPGQLVGSILSSSQQSLSAWQAITDGGFTITVDGGAAQIINNLNFGAVTSLNGVAAVINAALNGADIEWRANESRFRVISDTSGATSTVSFMTNNLDTPIASMLGMLSTSEGAYLVQGVDLQTGGEVVADFDDRFGQKWYTVYALDATDDDILEIDAYVRASSTRHAQGYTSDDTTMLSAADTTNIGYLLKQLGSRKTGGQYSSTTPYAFVSALARIQTTNYAGVNTVIDLMYKQMPGVTAEQLTTTQANALQGHNVNVYAEYDNDTNVYQYGNMASGDPIDLIFGLDWLAVDMETGAFNVNYTTTTRIPQTDGGVQLFEAAYAQSCERGRTNGLLAPGVWNSDGFGTLKKGDYLQNGYYIYTESVDVQSQADREARLGPPSKVAVKCAGSIREVDVEIVVNR